MRVENFGDCNNIGVIIMKKNKLRDFNELVIDILKENKQRAEQFLESALEEYKTDGDDAALRKELSKVVFLAKAFIKHFLPKAIRDYMH